MKYYVQGSFLVPPQLNGSNFESSQNHMVSLSLVHFEKNGKQIFHSPEVTFFSYASYSESFEVNYTQIINYTIQKLSGDTCLLARN